MISLSKVVKNNIEYKNLINKLSLDKDIINNVRSILYLNDNTYIIKVYDLDIGIIKVNKEIDDSYSIDVGILDKYRSNNYGSESLLLITNYINNFNKVLLRTEYNNFKLINSAIKVGYIYDLLEIEKTIYEGVPSLVLSKTNKFYKKR